jgi:hypothetical protein
MRTLLATIVTIVIGACGPSSGGGVPGSDGGGGGGGGDGGGGDTSCDNAADCGGDQVCNPDGNECASDLPCENAGQCGGGGVCSDGTCAPNETGGECADDNNCLTGETCNDGHCGCLGVAFQAEPVTPNMLIVLDRSGSMANSGGGDSKWNIARDALDQVLTDHGDNVRFGLDMFAANDFCAAGQINVNIGDGTANAISNAYGSETADSGTPLHATMNALRNYNGLKDTSHPNYVLLLTDGYEECGGPAPSGPVQQLRNQTPSVKTFVVGFGSGLNSTGKAQLNDMAVKGGTALPGTTKYYQANDATGLSNALSTILGTVLSCSYTLDQVPEDLADLYVYQDETAIDRDTTHTDGWDYDPATGELTFYGAACDALENGSVTDLNIVYGCPGVDVE